MLLMTERIVRLLDGDAREDNEIIEREVSSLQPAQQDTYTSEDLVGHLR